MSTLATLTVRLNAQIAEFQSEFKEAAASAKKFQDEFQGTATKAVAVGNILSTAFSVGVQAIGQLTNAVLENASVITDLSRKTGLAMSTIQQFQFVAEQTGTSVDAFTNAAFRLGTNLAGGSKSVVAAVEQLGLSFRDLQSLSPDQQFNKIAAALERMESPQERNRIALTLFGREARSILPAIAEGYSKLASEARVASDAQILALDAAGDAVSRFKRNTLNFATEVAGGIILAGEAAKKSGLIETLKQIAIHSGNVGDALVDMSLKAQALSRVRVDINLPAPAELLRGENYVQILKEARQRVSELTSEQRRQLDAAIKLGVQQEDLTKEFKLSATELRVYNQLTSEAARGSKAHESAAEKQKRVLQQLRDTIDDNTRSLKLFHGELPGFELDLQRVMSLPFVSFVPELKNLRKGFVDSVEGALRDLPGIGIDTERVFKLPEVKQTFLQGVFGGDFGSRLGQTIIGALQGGGSVLKSVGALIGTQIASGLGETISKHFKNIFGSILSGILPGLGGILGSLLGKLGGLFDRNKGRDLVKDFAASFGGFDALRKRLSELGAEGEKLWIKLTQGVGRNNPEQAKQAIAEVTAALDKFGTAEERAQKRVEALGRALDAVNQKAELFAAPFRKLIESGSTEQVSAKLAEMAQRGQAEFERLGTFAAATFAGLVRETGDAIGAISQLGPTFQVLKDGIEKFGLSSTGTINELLSLFNLVNDAVTGPILQSIQATGQIFAGLQDAGIRTADLFQTVATDIGASFRELEAKGGDVAKAMALSQPVLQRLWEAQQTYGEITDETTRKLLEQAEQQGLVGAHMKDVNKQILDVLIAIADVFGAKIPDALRATQTAASQAATGIQNTLGRSFDAIRLNAGRAADDIQRELNNIKVSPVEVPIIGDWEEFFRNQPKPEITEFARGGIVRKPTLALIGEAGPEAVIPLSSSQSGVSRFQTPEALDGGDTYISIPGAEFRRALETGTNVVVKAIVGNRDGNKTNLFGRGVSVGAF